MKTKLEAIEYGICASYAMSLAYIIVYNFSGWIERSASLLAELCHGTEL